MNSTQEQYLDCKNASTKMQHLGSTWIAAGHSSHKWQPLPAPRAFPLWHCFTLTISITGTTVKLRGMMPYLPTQCADEEFLQRMSETCLGKP
jgi:hypothetical protein